MGSQKPREQRRPVVVTCRLRGDGGWSDVTICNLSEHGMMARCDDPPPRGAFIEVRKGAVTIVGQVRWSRDGRIGVRTQERIDLASVLEGQAEHSPNARNDRRRHIREAAVRSPGESPAEIAARSRRWSRLFDWVIVAALGIVAAVALAQQVEAVFSEPLQRARTSLAGN